METRHCGRCGHAMPLFGFRRCPAPPRDADDGNICYPAAGTGLSASIVSKVR